MEENWKEIEGYDGAYFVSDLGRVKSITRYVPNKLHGRRKMIGKILKQAKLPTGYAFVCLGNMGNKSQFYVHRLVMKHFVNDSEMEVNHKNFIKDDNRLCNLEYVTHLDNVIHYRLSKSDCVGVTKAKNDRKYRAQITVNRKLIELGRFFKKEDAIKARTDYYNSL